MINEEYYDNLDKMVAELPESDDLPSLGDKDESQLQIIADGVTSSVNKVTDLLNTALSGLKDPICEQIKKLQDLITVPSVEDIIEYIQSLVALFTAQYEKLLAIQAKLVAQLASLASKLQEKVQSILDKFTSDAPAFQLPEFTALELELSC